MVDVKPEAVIADAAALRELYGEPMERALIKEIDYVAPTYQKFIEAAPFAALASVGPRGVDISPRGDAPGFVKVADPRTLLLPDRRGNNRVDTLSNIVEDGRVSLLFLIPGIGETLRVIGTAQVVTDPALLDEFVVKGKAPVSVLVIRVQRVYFQCQKAIARSGLWLESSHAAREDVPTGGQMLEAIDQSFDGATYDEGYPEYMRRTLY